MKATRLDIPDVMLIEPRVFGDERGFFFESFNQRQFDEAIGHHVEFVQDNHSYSTQGVLRGLHYQLPPFSQGKLVRVVQGEVFDVAVDIRRNSPTFGKWVGKKISSTNKHQMWIPDGFAHGFITLTDTAELLYKTTRFYAPESERIIIWNDQAIGISWPSNITPKVSLKDSKAQPLKKAELP